jgi:hypothetical protein
MPDEQDRFAILASANSPAGRTSVKLEWQIRPLGNVLESGAHVYSGPAYDTGAPGVTGSTVEAEVLVTGLYPGTAYHWRARIASRHPFFPHGRWLHLPLNGHNQTDFRLGGAQTGLGPDSDVSQAFAPVAFPNPLRSSTTIEYRVAQAGPVELTVFDVQGRRVAVLVDGFADAGPGYTKWNARAQDGTPVGAGIYFLRLTTGSGLVEGRKLVVAP